MAILAHDSASVRRAVGRRVAPRRITFALSDFNEEIMNLNICYFAKTNPCLSLLVDVRNSPQSALQTV
eukprot:6185774-Pleurochrysis_carterae.AAC.2